MYCMSGASRRARAAAGTLFIINGSEIVNHRYCAVGTKLCTLGTSDASVYAHLSCERALIVIGAINSHAVLACHNADNSVRTGLRAKSAAETTA